jgi:hypothetical protein
MLGFMTQFAHLWVKRNLNYFKTGGGSCSVRSPTRSRTLRARELTSSSASLGVMA